MFRCDLKPEWETLENIEINKQFKILSKLSNYYDGR